MKQLSLSLGLLLLVSLSFANQTPKNATVMARHIGDYYGGGIIYYINPVPQAAAGKRGLIVALNNAYPTPLALITATANTINTFVNPFTGNKNTQKMLAAATARSIRAPAAEAAHQYATSMTCSTCTEWYLPSKDELKLLYLQKKIINAAVKTYKGNSLMDRNYWSSTQIGSRFGWAINFDDGLVNANGNLLQTTLNVRAVRAF